MFFEKSPVAQLVSKFAALKKPELYYHDHKTNHWTVTAIQSTP
jgi:hypothetical protein